jgi:hypothetical protein
MPVLPLPPDADVILRLPALLYVGPDQILPLTSILGAITGFLLLFWQRFVALVQRAYRAITGRSAAAKERDRA